MTVKKPKKEPTLEERVLELESELWVAKEHIKHIFELLKEMKK